MTKPVPDASDASCGRPHRRSLLALAALSPLLASCFTSSRMGALPMKFTPPPGKPGEFDFLAGEWRISHRRLAPGASEWDVFEGEATCWTILGGVGSVEELRIPTRNFSGMGLRLLDIEKRIWSDFWVNAKSGVLTTPGQTGGFENGVGTFLTEDMENGKPVLYRGVWDEIGPNACRWRQGASYDDGETWTDSWIMNWRRA
jgi:hypothetical protein